MSHRKTDPMPVITDDEFAEGIRAALHDRTRLPPDNVSIGITGTREILGHCQQQSLGMLISAMYRESTGYRQFHHGCCVGTDECGHYLASEIPGVQIHGHPGYGISKNAPYRMNIRPGMLSVIHPEKPYKDRNQDIVTACKLLLACPRYPEHDQRSARSGTWQTIRFARNTRKPVILILPSGSIMHEHRGVNQQ